MIAQRIPQSPDHSPDNMYALVTRLATHASDRKLATILAITLLAGAGLLVTVPAAWPLAALAGTIGAISLWGLIAHRVAALPSPLLALIQVGLVAAGVILAIAAAIRIWYAMLGPRWML